MLARVNHRASRVILAIAVSVAALGLALIGLPSPASACSCAMPTFEQQRATASAIFEGRVASERVEGDERIVAFRVTQAWSGVEHETVEIHTPTSGAQCGYTFEVGQHYLVFAMSQGELPYVSLCSRTARMDDASEDRQLLGSGTIPVDVVDAVDEPAPRPVPATRAGCASCAVHAPTAGAPAGGILFAGLILSRARRRR